VRAYLAGGPKHGAIYEISNYNDLLFAVSFPVGQLFFAAQPPRPQKPEWWQPWKFPEYSRKLKEWNEWEPPIYHDVTFEQIVYRRKWKLSDGDAIYWYEGTATAPFDTPNEIFHYLWQRRSEWQHANHGIFKDCHWEMGHDWYRAVWNTVFAGQPLVQPGMDGGMLVGLPVEIKGPAGAPRIVKDEEVGAIHG
jgi:hypothetical protein